MTEGDDGGGAIRIIAINSTLRAEAAAIGPKLAAMAGRLPDDDAQASALLAILLEKAPMYGLPAKSDGEWAATWDAYLKTLWDLPPAAVEEAFARWKRNELYPNDPGRHSFYPKDNELFALAGPYWTKLRTAAWRARRAMDKIEAERPVDPKVQKMVGAGFAELAKELKGNAKTNPLIDPPKPRESPQQKAAAILRQGSRPEPARATEDPGEIL